MANQKISELDPGSTPLSGNELVEIVQGGSNRRVTTQDVADLGGGGGTWGSITGTLSSQTDLQSALDAKLGRAPLVQSVASAATVTPNVDTNDMVIVTALAEATTLANPSGSPSQGQGLIVRIKDNGNAFGITYGSQYRAVGVELPTATIPDMTIYLGCIYNTTDTKWDVIGVKEEV